MCSTMLLLSEMTQSFNICAETTCKQDRIGVGSGKMVDFLGDL